MTAASSGVHKLQVSGLVSVDAPLLTSLCEVCVMFSAGCLGLSSGNACCGSVLLSGQLFFHYFIAGLLWSQGFLLDISSAIFLLFDK